MKKILLLLLIFAFVCSCTVGKRSPERDRLYTTYGSHTN